MEDLKCYEWSPLTEEELHALNPTGLWRGKVEIDRYVLARLLGERDRLQCVLESSLWLIEQMIGAGMIEDIHVKMKDPDELERAIYALRVTIENCRGVGKK